MAIRSHLTSFCFLVKDKRTKGWHDNLPRRGLRAGRYVFPGMADDSDAWDGQTLSLFVEWFLRSCARSACAWPVEELAI